MGILDFFKKKKSSFDIDDLDSGLNLDSLKSDTSSSLGDLDKDFPSSDPLTKSNSGFDEFDKESQGLPSFKETKYDTEKYEGPDFRSPNTQQTTSTTQTHASNKDMELVLEKLNTIKAEITNINHRLDKIEKSTQRKW